MENEVGFDDESCKEISVDSSTSDHTGRKITSDSKNPMETNADVVFSNGELTISKCKSIEPVGKRGSQSSMKVQESESTFKNITSRKKTASVYKSTGSSNTNNDQFETSVEYSITEAWNRESIQNYKYTVNNNKDKNIVGRTTGTYR